MNSVPEKKLLPLPPFRKGSPPHAPFPGRGERPPARPISVLPGILLLAIPFAWVPGRPALPPRRRPTQAKEGPALRKLREEIAWAWARGDQARLWKKIRELAGRDKGKGPFLFLSAGIEGSRGPLFHRNRALDSCRRFLSWFPPEEDREWRRFLNRLPRPMARHLPLTPSFARNLAREWMEDLRSGPPLLWAADRKTLKKDLVLLDRRTRDLEKRKAQAEKKIAFHKRRAKAWEEKLREDWKPRHGRIQGWNGDWITDHILMHRKAVEKEEKRIRAWEEEERALSARIRAIRRKLREYGKKDPARGSAAPPGSYSSPAMTDQRRDPFPSNLWIRSPARSRTKSPPSPSRSRAAGAKIFPSSFPGCRTSPRNQPEGLKRRRAGFSFHWATRMFPSGRTPTATGRDRSPGAGEVENIIWKVPSRAKTWTHWLNVSATKSLSSQTANPMGRPHSSRGSPKARKENRYFPSGV